MAKEVGAQVIIMNVIIQDGNQPRRQRRIEAHNGFAEFVTKVARRGTTAGLRGLAGSRTANHERRDLVTFHFG
jgi:hypothetical protein